MSAESKAAHLSERLHRVLAEEIHRVLAEEIADDDPENDMIVESALAMLVAGFVVCDDAEPDPDLWADRMGHFSALTIKLMPVVHENVVVPMFRDLNARRQ
jgi:hypothetical protein